MTEKQIVPGEVVMLRSGGPQMTVVSIDDGQAECTWFDGSQQMFGGFPLHLLLIPSGFTAF